MFQRFARFCSLWLIAQILLPFTAPFPTCDLSDFLGNVHHQRAPLLPLNSRADGDYVFAPPLATTAGRLRLVVVSRLDVSSIVGVTPIVVLGRPFAAGVGAQQRLRNRPTVLRL